MEKPNRWARYIQYLSIRSSEIYKILGGILIVLFVGFFYFSYTHMPFISQFMFEWQVEKLGLRATCFGKVQAKWGEAQLEDIQLVPLHKNLSNVGKSACPNHHILLKLVKVQYRLKDFIRLRFRYLVIDGISGNFLINSQGAWELGEAPLNLTSDLRNTPSLSSSKSLEKSVGEMTKGSQEDIQKNQSIIIKNAHLLCSTPYGLVDIKGDMNVVDFLTRMVLGSGHVIFRTPVGPIEATIKIDKIEGRLWRLTMDTQGNNLFIKKARGSDAKTHLELIFNGHETSLNGSVTALDLSFPREHHSLKLYTPRVDFKIVYGSNHQFKGDFILKVLSLESDKLSGRDMDGTLTCEGKEHEISQAHGEFLFNKISHKSSLPLLKPFSFRSILDYKDFSLKFENILNANPFILASRGVYNLPTGVGDGVITSLPIEFSKNKVQPGAFSPYLEAYLKDVEGKVKIKGDFKWTKEEPGFSPKLIFTSTDLCFQLPPLSVVNLNGNLTFVDWSSFLTLPNQYISAAQIDFPHYKLKDVAATFQITPQNPFDIKSISATLKGKKISLALKDARFIEDFFKKTPFSQSEGSSSLGNH
jgi:hypothetical protein